MKGLSVKLIKEQLQTRKIKRDVDTKELYLGEGSLTEVANLSRFKNLQFLWLNENKLRTLNCLNQNCRLSELYLQNNCLVSVTGALGHLTSLRVLFLNNNQLEQLENVVKEIHKMQHLSTLNLFNNPLAQEPEYRNYIVFHIPSVKLLDRREVLKTERDSSQRLYDQDNVGMQDTIAFGRSSEGPPSLYYPGGQPSLEPTIPADFEVGNNFYRNNPPFEDTEQAVEERAMRRAVMEYTGFDWSKVPRSNERRVANKPFENPQIVTTRFR